jgi:dihydroorotase
MRQAMVLAKTLDKPIVAHSEDESLLAKGWAVHDGAFARRNGLVGNDPASEWKQLERDLQLVRETGCRYHICHISTKESVALIRAAKAEGLPVSCETGPHYLVLCDEELQDDGRFKMNPPIRSAADREALVAGLLDGTIDCIATDHAPHSAEEKAKGLRGSLNGIVGLECAFPILYTQLVETGAVPLATILNALCVAPRRLFGLPGGEIAPGREADLTVLDLDRPHVIDPAAFRSLGRATPFAGWGVSAAVAMTVCGGEVVYADLQNQEDAP